MYKYFIKNFVYNEKKFIEYVYWTNDGDINDNLGFFVESKKYHVNQVL
jgi:hypothetical protein